MWKVKPLGKGSSIRVKKEWELNIIKIMASKAASHVGSQYFYPNMVTGRVYIILLVVVDFFSFIFKMTVQFYETINLHVYQMLCLCSRWNAFATFSRDRTENSDAVMTEIRKEFSAKKTHPFASVVTKWPKWEFLKREKKASFRELNISYFFFVLKSTCTYPTELKNKMVIIYLQ